MQIQTLDSFEISALLPELAFININYSCCFCGLFHALLHLCKYVYNDALKGNTLKHLNQARAAFLKSIVGQVDRS